MKHGFIDQYSDLDSLIHRLDPRTKVLATLAFVVTVVATPPTLWLAFAFYVAFFAGLLFLSKLPPLYVLKRSLVIVPFVLLVAIFIPFLKQGEVAGSYNIWIWRVSITYDGLIVLWNVVIKACLSVLSMILLSATTGLTDLLKGLQQLGLPKLMVMILSFMYRYLFVLIDEAMRLWQARESRNFGGKRVWRIRTVGNMIGTLFIRSYERSERIYGAMLSRGFDGQVRTLSRLHLARADRLFGAVFLLSLAAITVIARFWGL